MSLKLGLWSKALAKVHTLQHVGLIVLPTLWERRRISDFWLNSRFCHFLTAVFKPHHLPHSQLINYPSRNWWLSNVWYRNRFPNSLSHHLDSPSMPTVWAGTIFTQTHLYGNCKCTERTEKSTPHHLMTNKSWDNVFRYASRVWLHFKGSNIEVKR